MAQVSQERARIRDAVPTARLGCMARGVCERVKRSVATPMLVGAVAVSGCAAMPTHAAEAKPAPIAPRPASGGGSGMGRWLKARHFQPSTQEGPSWCLVAAGQMSLKTATGKRVSQEALIPLMGTDQYGTTVEHAAAALTTYTFKDGLLYTEVPVRSVRQLDADLKYDIGTLGVAPIVAASMSELPYDQGLRGRHALVVPGYNPELGEVVVDDPETPGLNGGVHVMSDSQLYGSLLPGPNGDTPYIVLVESVANPLEAA